VAKPVIHNILFIAGLVALLWLLSEGHK
jgi:hypothetical protein